MTFTSRVSHESIAKNGSLWSEIIVNFLAVLELAKQRELTFEQEELFSEIHVVFRHDEITN